MHQFGGRGGPLRPTQDQIVNLLTLSGRSFGRQMGIFAGIIFACFCEGVLVALLGDFWAPKVPKRLPKRSHKGAKSEPAGTLRNMLKAWQALYGRHMGRSLGGSGRRLFLARVSRPCPRAFRGAFFADFVRFGAPFRDPGAPLWAQKAALFQSLCFVIFFVNFL